MDDKAIHSPDPTANSKLCKVVIQQCLQANLKFDTDDQPVSISNGMVVFVCFLQGASQDCIPAIAKSIMNVKLSEPCIDGEVGGNNARRKSVIDCDYDILVIPQATLGGKLKGSTTQYHGLVDKDLGSELFKEFVGALRNFKTPKPGTRKVEAGVYGARQILNMDTNGPFTHVFEF